MNNQTNHWQISVKQWHVRWSWARSVEVVVCHSLPRCTCTYDTHTVFPVCVIVGDHRCMMVYAPWLIKNTIRQHGWCYQYYLPPWLSSHLGKLPRFGCLEAVWVLVHHYDLDDWGASYLVFPVENNIFWHASIKWIQSWTVTSTLSQPCLTTHPQN